MEFSSSGPYSLAGACRFECDRRFSRVVRMWLPEGTPPLQSCTACPFDCGVHGEVVALLRKRSGASPHGGPTDQLNE